MTYLLSLINLGMFSHNHQESTLLNLFVQVRLVQDNFPLYIYAKELQEASYRQISCLVTDHVIFSVNCTNEFVLLCFTTPDSERTFDVV